MNISETYPRLTMRLNAQEADGEIMYSFLCISQYTSCDFTVHGGLREDLAEAVAELSCIAPQAMLGMKEEGYDPNGIEIMLAKELPDLETIYQTLMFNLNTEDYSSDNPLTLLRSMAIN